MLESIRGRLLLWYSLVMMILIAMYAGMVTYAYWSSLIDGVDAALHATAATIATAISPDASGTLDLNFPPEFRNTAFGAEAGGVYYIVWNSAGQLIDRSQAAPTFSAPPAAGVASRGAAREVVSPGPNASRILVGRPLAPVHAAVRALALRIAAAGGLLLVLSLAGGSFLAGRALEPIARISKTAGAMIGGDLMARIPIEDTDSELEQVARALNTTFDRLQTALEQQRQFTADASHEYRTPLAVLRAEFDWVLKRPRSEADYRLTIAKASQAVERLTDISDRLLTIARGHHASDSGWTLIDLSTVMAETVRLLYPLANDHQVVLAVDLDIAWIRGDRGLLADAFANVVSNAISYNRSGGRVTITVGTDADTAVVVVRDTGVGIAAEDLPRVFDRFYRADRSRGRESGGAGLGLAIVKAVVTAHRGSVACSSELGVGSEFSLRFPSVANETKG
jgi:two-component system, OmpR family, sensor kinase